MAFNVDTNKNSRPAEQKVGVVGSAKVFRIEFDSTVGRHLVANKDIEPGEIIIDEPAIIRGPLVEFKELSSNTFCDTDSASESNSKTVTGTRTVCCVCFEACQLNYTCLHCHSSLFCSQSCSSSLTHKENECRIFNHINNQGWLQLLENVDTKSMCNVISTIRCLFMRYRNPIHWMQIRRLQSKVEELIKANIGAFDLIDEIFKRLNWYLFMDEEEDDDNRQIKNKCEDLKEDTESLIDAARHCLGVMRMNAYSHVKNSVGFEGLYFFTALMAHSCIANTDRNFDLHCEGRMVVKAAYKIFKDEPLTTSYLCLMDDTRQRHAEMKSNWFFTCSCKRCLDDTELKTFMSTVLISNAANSTFCLDTDTNTNPKCDSDLDVTLVENNSYSDIEDIVQRIRPFFPKTLSDIDTLESLLTKFDNGKYLHPNHSVFSQVKLYLSLLYGRQKGGIADLNDLQLLRKYNLCIEVLHIYDVIYPGIYQCKGELLFELWIALREIINRNLDIPPTESSRFQKDNVALEAHSILKHSLQNSPQDEMNKVLIEEYPQLENS